MYKVFQKNLIGFSQLFKEDERLSLAEPLFLLSDIETYNSNKLQNTQNYKNLKAIMKKANELKTSRKYHSFGMFLNELHLQYFDFENLDKETPELNPEVLEYQIGLLHQFMFPAYYQ